MTTILIFGAFPFNHLRSFTGAMGIENPHVMRVGQVFLDDYAVMNEERRAALDAVIKEYAPQRTDADHYHQAEREAVRLYDAQPKEFMVEYLGIQEDETVHYILNAQAGDAAKEAYRLLGNPPTFGPYIRWKYIPEEHDTNIETARITGECTLPDDVGEKYELAFSWNVRVKIDRHHRLHRGPIPATPTKTSTVETTQWNWPVPKSEADAETLARLLRERNDMDRENGYGFDYDTSDVSRQIHDLVARLG